MGSSANGSRTATTNGGAGRAPVDKEVDFANYFCTYAFLYHQKEMLSDRVRMDAYYDAVFRNPSHFLGKWLAFQKRWVFVRKFRRAPIGFQRRLSTHASQGTGSGILAIWSAQAGARKVYAVEATKMAEHARQLVKENKLEDVVEVIEGSIEDVTLPEKVDVIISEWMGYFLLRESMFDSVICARDRWLKPTGVMYPSHARMWLAPIRTGLSKHKMEDYEGCMKDWRFFVEDTHNYYGVDMSCLTKSFSEEQKKYYLQTSLWNNLHPNQVIGTAAIIKELDCLTATVDDILNLQASIKSSINAGDTRFCGFGGWFDVHFRVFLLHPSALVHEGDDLIVDFSMSRSKENHRLMEVELNCEIRQSSGELIPPSRKKFYIE
ncbi:hypothetical protein RJ639_042497 [Escallonia herrerae]|uniref:Protein arginine N-methyltransferase PRMT10 n=1 Tax=Escallonia herrerae TaxID=1293975 RepID=A0AA88WF08_9ASTE|nr:hypothetical protein RJ639_042497 [Escallonia herrerae]